MKPHIPLRRGLLAAPIAVALFGAGCVAVSNDLPETAKSIEREMLPAWHADSSVASSSEADAKIARDLYSIFSDQVALSLVEESLLNNTDLRSDA